MITLPGISRAILTIMGQIVEERLDALPVQVFPPSAVSGLFEPVGVEYLLELMLDRNREIGLGKMERLGHQGEARIRHDGLGLDQVLQKAIEAGLFVEDITVLPFPPSSVAHAWPANLPHNLRLSRHRLAHVY